MADSPAQPEPAEATPVAPISPTPEAPARPLGSPWMEVKGGANIPEMTARVFTPKSE